MKKIIKIKIYNLLNNIFIVIIYIKKYLLKNIIFILIINKGKTIFQKTRFFLKTYFYWIFVGGDRKNEYFYMIFYKYLRGQSRKNVFFYFTMHFVRYYMINLMKKTIKIKIYNLLNNIFIVIIYIKKYLLKNIIFILIINKGKTIFQKTRFFLKTYFYWIFVGGDRKNEYFYMRSHKYLWRLLEKTYFLILKLVF